MRKGETIRFLVTMTEIIGDPEPIPDPEPDPEPTPSDYPTTFDYYIGPSGDNANPGTIGLPWAFTALNSKASQIAGKTVGLLDGTYRCPTNLANDTPWVSMPVGASGTPDRHTVIAAVTPRQAIFTENNGSGGYGTRRAWMLNIAANYTDFWGWAFIDVGAASGFHPLNVSHLRFYDCQFEDWDLAKSGQPHDNYGVIRCGGTGAPVTDILVENCLFKDIVDGHAVGPLFVTKDVVMNKCTCIEVDLPVFYMKREAGSGTVSNCFMYRASHLQTYNGTSTTQFLGPLFLGDDQTADGNPIYQSTPTTFHHNICVNYNHINGNTGETGMNLVPFHMYNNTILLHNGSAGGEHYSSFIVGAIPVSPTVALNQRVYNNIFGFLDPTGAGSSAWLRWGVIGTPQISSTDVMEIMDYNGFHNIREIDYAGPTTYTTIGALQALGFENGGAVVTTYGMSDQNGTTPADFRLVSGSHMNAGKIGGVSGGATCHRGAWDGVYNIYGTSQIGCNF